MSEKFKWLIKKTSRSVDQLRLWAENPRLNPDETHLTLNDFAEDLTFDENDKKDFYELINSIVEVGFVPADPVIVWKNEENNKYYVAEGNRRLVALKLLRKPHKAPRAIRGFIKKASEKINLNEIEKISVNIAPTFEKAEWYINQRNSFSSLQKRWTRVQQQRWIVNLYEKYNGDIEKIISVTKHSKSKLESFFRILKIKDFVKIQKVKKKLTDEEYELANSYRFPITILERFFNFSDVKEKWGIEYDGINVNIISIKSSFYNAFAELVKRIVNSNDDKIDTRLNKDDLDGVLESLPKVLFTEDKNEEEEEIKKETSNNENTSKNTNTTYQTISDTTDVSVRGNITQSNTFENLKGDPKRLKLVLKIYELKTDSYRLEGLFSEFKKISLNHKNLVSVGLRVFLDLSVLNYIETEGIEDAIKSQYKEELMNINLKRRLEYLKKNHLTKKLKGDVNKLLDPSYQYSLDVLNGYIHGQETHNLNKEFLNSFWDFLFPLFKELLNIREN